MQPTECNPESQTILGASVYLIENWLQYESNWLESLIREVRQLQAVIGLGFLQESLKVLSKNRSNSRQLLNQLLALEVDITRIGKLQHTLEQQIEAYMELCQRIAGQRFHSSLDLSV